MVISAICAYSTPLQSFACRSHRARLIELDRSKLPAGGPPAAAGCGAGRPRPTTYLAQPSRPLGPIICSGGPQPARQRLWRAVHAPEGLGHATHGVLPTPPLLAHCPHPGARRDAEVGDGGHRWGEWPTMGRGIVLGPPRPRRRPVAAHSVPMKQMYLHRASVTGTSTDCTAGVPCI